MATGAPTVTKVSPATGPAAGGTNVTITGTNLGTATAVLFGATHVGTGDFSVKSGTKIVALSPPGNVGDTVGVSVVNPNGQGVLPHAYAYTATQPPPPPGSGDGSPWPAVALFGGLAGVTAFAWHHQRRHPGGGIGRSRQTGRTPSYGRTSSIFSSSGQRRR